MALPGVRAEERVGAVFLFLGAMRAARRVEQAVAGDTLWLGALVGFATRRNTCSRLWCTPPVVRGDCGAAAPAGVAAWPGLPQRVWAAAL